MLLSAPACGALVGWVIGWGVAADAGPHNSGGHRLRDLGDGATGDVGEGVRAGLRVTVQVLGVGIRGALGDAAGAAAAGPGPPGAEQIPGPDGDGVLLR